MAITRPDRVGRVREKLADLLNDYFKNHTFSGCDLDSNNPYYSSIYFDGCSWDGTSSGRDERLHMHVFSWSTMSECIKNGISVTMEGPFDAEIFPDG